MKSSIQFFILSLLIMGIGAAMLVNVFPSISSEHWGWPLALGLAGLLVLGLCGINKLTIVTGPLLIIAGGFTLMRQAGRFTVWQELPILVLAIGGLMLLSMVAPVPAAGWAGSQSKK